MNNPLVCLLVTLNSPNPGELSSPFDLIDLSLEKQVVLTDLDTFISWAAPLGIHYHITYGGVVADSSVIEYVLDSPSNTWDLPCEVVDFAKEQIKKPEDFEGQEFTIFPVHQLKLLNRDVTVFHIEVILLVDELEEVHLSKFNTLFNQTVYEVLRQKFIDHSLHIYVCYSGLSGIKGYKEYTSLTLDEIKKLDLNSAVERRMNLYGYNNIFFNPISFRELIKNMDNYRPLDSYKDFTFKTRIFEHSV